MKRIAFLITALLLLGSLIVGCSGAKTYTDSSETIKASVGQEFVIALDSNPTTGYDWEEKHFSNKLTLLENRYAASVSSDWTQAQTGTGGTRYFRFKALKEGYTDITLVYKRSWETEILKTEVFNIWIK